MLYDKEEKYIYIYERGKGKGEERQISNKRTIGVLIMDVTSKSNSLHSKKAKAKQITNHNQILPSNQ